MITTVLFDLDGTLLPMDQDLFNKAYFKGLIKKAAPYGYNPEKLVSSVWSGVEAMVKNNGTRLRLTSRCFGTALKKFTAKRS